MAARRRPCGYGDVRVPALDEKANILFEDGELIGCADVGGVNVKSFDSMASVMGDEVVRAVVGVSG